MSITWTTQADSRQNLGFSGIIQPMRMTFGASDYLTGGYAVTPGQFGFGRIHGLWVIAQAGTALATTVELRYNRTSGKIQAFGGAASGIALAEVANGFDLSAFTFDIIVFGY